MHPKNLFSAGRLQMELSSASKYQSPTYIKNVRSGEYLFKNGTPAYGVYYIYSGSVELVYKTDEGFLIKEIKTAGDIIGEDNIEINYFVYDAFALEDTQVCFIEKSSFHFAESDESFF